MCIISRNIEFMNAGPSKILIHMYVSLLYHAITTTMIKNVMKDKSITFD